MNYAVIKKFDIANGPGVRVSLFVSGCRHKCKNCFNSEAWDFNYGSPFTEDTLNELTEALDKSYIEGFSLLGGEPFEPENQPNVCEILKHLKQNLSRFWQTMTTRPRRMTRCSLPAFLSFVGSMSI